LFAYSAKVLPVVIEQITPNHFEEHYPDYQLPMPGAGHPSLSQYLRTLDGVHHIVLIYIPSIILFFFFLGPLIFYLWAPILASTSILPSVIRYHTSRFIAAVERCASLRPLPFPVAVLIQTPKTSYRLDNLPFRRIRTAPSICGLERLDLSLHLLSRCTPAKK